MSATLEGVRRAEGFFVGVVAIDEGRTGVVVNTELPADRLVDTVSLAKDRSRNAYSLL
jgi:hypothetical protein